MAGAPTAIAEEPYVGLAHFTEEYADRFFGRDTECALIIGNLRAARLTLLYAESGVGKSSVLRAGVVARLHEAAERDVRARGRPRLVPVVFSNWSEGGVRPLVRALAEAVRPYREDGAAPDLPADDLERALETVSDELDATVLVILDQFEEYFLYADEADESHRVAAQIARCVNRPDLRANFLISIREDAYARLGDLFRGKVVDVYGNFLHLEFLDRAGGREAIERPIERVGEVEDEPYTLEPALVDAVLDQVGRGGAEEAENGDGDGDGRREQIETTYLQLVMRRLWEEETGAGSHHLGLGTLEGLGGAQAIIRGHLDRAMEGGGDGGDGLSAGQRRVAAAIFHFLVTSGGTKIALTARDLADLSGIEATEIEPVLHHLSSPRLHILRPVVAEDDRGEPRYEIFHDALAQPIVEWRTRVEEAELDARLKRERVEKEAAQRAAAEAERREARERRRKRLALALLGLTVLALLAGAIYFAVDQSNLADERDAATESVRAAERIDVLAQLPTFGPAAAALASIEAYRLSATTEARQQTLAALQLNAGMPKFAVGHTRGVNAVAYLPGSHMLASGGSDQTVRIWSGRGERRFRPLIDSHAILSVAASAPNRAGTRVLAAGEDGGTVVLWRVNGSGRAWGRTRIPGKPSKVRGLAFDPGAPSVLATGDSGGLVTLWDLADPSKPARLGSPRHLPGEVNDLAFDASGGRLYVAGTRGVRSWAVSAAGFSGAPPTTQTRHWASSVATAANGSLAFGVQDWIELWDASSRRWLQLSVPGSVSSLAFAGGGSVLVSGDFDWNVVTWDVASGRPFGPPRTANQAAIRDVAVSSDGETIAAADDNRLVKLWPLHPAHALATTVGGLNARETGTRPAEVWSLAVGAHRRVAIAAGTAGTTIWRLRRPSDTESVPHPIARISATSIAVAYHGDLLAVGRGHSFVIYDTGPDCPTMKTKGGQATPCRLAQPVRSHSEEPVRDLALARIGKRLIVASSGFKHGEGFLNLWDATEAPRGKIVHLASRHFPSRLLEVAFSTADRLIAAGTRDGKLRMWDISDPENPKGSTISRPRGNEAQPVTAVAFSPDGKLLASGGLDQQVVLREVGRDDSGEVTTNQIPDTLFQTQTIFTLAFSPDGKTLASGDGDGSTCVYEVESRRPIGSHSCLLGHHVESFTTAAIWALSFARVPGGGSALLTAGPAQPILAWSSVLWNLKDTDRVDEAILTDTCVLASQNLTGPQWGEVFGATRLANKRHETCLQYQQR